MTPLVRLNAWFVLLAILAGCAATDPLLDKSDWQPAGVNEMNIAAEVVNPADLQHGREPATGSDGERAAAAVARLRTGHVKPLPDSSLTDLRVTGSGSAPAAASPP